MNNETIKTEGNREYVIRILATTDCWIADTEGDPGRTLVLENAKTFDHMPVVEVAELARKYPARTFSGELKLSCPITLPVFIHLTGSAIGIKDASKRWLIRKTVNMLSHEAFQILRNDLTQIVIALNENAEMKERLGEAERLLSVIADMTREIELVDAWPETLYARLETFHDKAREYLDKQAREVKGEGEEGENGAN